MPRTRSRRRETASDEAHVPAEPDPTQAGPWIPCPHEDQGRASRAGAAAGQGPQAARRHDALQVAVPAAHGRFSRADRLRKPREFQRLAAHGRREAGPLCILLLARRPDDAAGRVRLGLTVSRKVGGAVERNRVKRRVREWFRGARSELPAGADLVVIARRPAAITESFALHRELDRMASRLGTRHG